VDVSAMYASLQRDSWPRKVAQADIHLHGKRIALSPCLKQVSTIRGFLRVSSSLVGTLSVFWSSLYLYNDIGPPV